MVIKKELESSSALELDSPEWYLNRELTWLAFNKRVLNEARDERNPLLARVFFVAVVGANLDEFFMKRIGGLKQQVGAGVKKRSLDGMLPQEQIDACYTVYREILQEQSNIVEQLRLLLETEGIVFLRYDDLNSREKKEMDAYFKREVFPLMTPQGIDPAHPFPFISNLSMNLLVTTVEPRSKQEFLNRVKVPSGVGVPRFIQVGRKNRYMTFEDLVANNLEELFPGLEIQSCELFRVTRNAITERAEEKANDLLAVIESALRDRKFAGIVRLQIDRDMAPIHRGMLAAELGVHEKDDVFEEVGFMSKRDFMEICKIDKPDLQHPVHQPCDHPQLLLDDPNLFHIIRKQKSILLQHPYESFDTTVALFLKQASIDPKVLVIKMTLYRTGSHSRIIQYLIDAAQNGKQVAVVVELQARFDESANIKWAETLEDKEITKALYKASQAGVQVDLIVRDSCRLRPGVQGLSENVRVVSVVGRFLEHARIYYFKNAGEEEYYIGSADLMKRNLEARVEVVTPVEDETLKTRLREILDIQTENRRSVWEMQPDGTYVQRQPKEKDDHRTVHEILIHMAEQRLADSVEVNRKRAVKSAGRSHRKRNITAKSN